MGDLVLKWDKVSEAKAKHSKFQKVCLSPYETAKKIGDATYRLQSLQGDLENLPINASDWLTIDPIFPFQVTSIS